MSSSSIFNGSFPSNFVFFTLGIFSYKLHRYLQKIQPPLKINVLVLISFIFSLLIFQLIPASLSIHHFKEWMFYLTLCGAIPFLFRFDQVFNSYLYRLLGDLSYPLYISHLLVLSSAILVFKNLSVITELLLVIGFSLLLHYCISKPMDKIRAIRVKKERG